MKSEVMLLSLQVNKTVKRNKSKVNRSTEVSSRTFFSNLFRSAQRFQRFLM